MSLKNKAKQFLSEYSKITSWSRISNFIKIIFYKFYNMLKQGSLRNILSVSSILKILFLYSMVIFYIIIFTFDFSSKLFTNSDNHRIAVYSVSGRIGEHRSYVRTLRALDKMGWDYVGISFDEEYMSEKWISHLYKVAASVVNIITHTEFNLALTHYVNVVPYGYNIVYLNMPDLSLYSLKHKFKEDFAHLSEYDAYIDLDSVVNGDNALLKDVLKNHNKEAALIIPAYLAQDFDVLIKPNEYKTAVITGSLWGCNRGSYRFKDAIRRLADEKSLVAYGLEQYFDYLGDAYLGMVEKYGDPLNQLVELQRKGGIALIVHNLEHLLQGLPTSRLAEAIMSGSVMISDKHPFLQKYFGDNALYFDAFANSEEIYRQIKSHIEWIRSHKDEAQKMTENAYNIFIKDWTIEIQLKNVMELVEKSKGL